jgi:hypothetical protein
MRIIKFLLTSLLSLVILGGITFLISREVLLFLGNARVKSSLTILKKTYASQSYFQKCKEKGFSFISGDDPARIQLRFLSSTEYVVEVLCNQSSIRPIVIEKRQLPWLVQKVPGSSGVVWGEDRSAIRLEIFNRSKTIGVEDEFVVNLSAGDELGVSPNASCAGFGFACCMKESQQGVGEKITAVSDCPKSCFNSCISRPVVLAFNFQPVPDDQAQAIIIRTGESITFSYFLDKGQAESVIVKLDYGDGTMDQFHTEKQIIDHNYLCSQKECVYQVRLMVEDNLGIPAADLPITSTTVIVKG